MALRSIITRKATLMPILLTTHLPIVEKKVFSLQDQQLFPFHLCDTIQYEVLRFLWL